MLRWRRFLLGRAPKADIAAVPEPGHGFGCLSPAEFVVLANDERRFWPIELGKDRREVQALDDRERAMIKDFLS